MIEEKIVLESRRWGSMTITQYEGLPKGLSDMVMEWRRSLQYHGVFLSITEQELRFVGESRKFLIKAKEGEGVEADIRFTLYSRIGSKPWHVDLVGKVNFNNHEDNGTEFRVNITTNYFEQALTNREDVSVSPLAITTLDGAGQEPVPTVPISMTSRTLLKQWRQRTTDANFSDNIPPFYSEGNLITCNRIEWGPITVNNMLGVATYGNTMVLNESDITDTLQVQEAGMHQISSKLKFKLWVAVSKFRNVQIYSESVRLVAKHYRGGSLLNTFEHMISPGVLPANRETHGPFEGKLTNIYVHNSEELMLDMGGALSLSVGDTVKVFLETRFRTTHIYISVEILPESFLDFSGLTATVSSTANCVPVYEALHHTIQHITGIKDGLYSEYYGRTDSYPRTYTQDGAGSKLAFISGLQIRNVPDKEAGMKFKDQIKTLQAVDNIGMGTEWVEGKRVVRVEPADYFYQESEGVYLTQPVQVVTRSMPELLWSTYKVGFQKWEEDAETGADEWNTQHQYASLSKAVKLEREIMAPYRADGTGIEKLRRAQYVDKPNESSGADNDIFLLSLWREGANLLLRNTQGFSSVSGTIAGDTATNLVLSPKRIFQKHLRWVSMQYRQIREGEVKFKTGIQNINLATQQTTESTVTSESASVKVDALPAPYFFPEVYSIKYPLSETDRSSILRNPYKWIRFADEEKRQYKGYLLSLRWNRQTGLCELELLRKS